MSKQHASNLRISDELQRSLRLACQHPVDVDRPLLALVRELADSLS